MKCVNFNYIKNQKLLPLSQRILHQYLPAHIEMERYQQKLQRDHQVEYL